LKSGALDPAPLRAIVLLEMSSLKPNPLRWSVDWSNLRQMERLLMWFPLLGPQRRIYQDLLRQLKARRQDVEPWERLGPEVRDAAKRVTQILKDQLGWPPSTVFLPQDPADIPFWDRTGGLAGTEAIMAVEEAFLVEMPEDFWLSLPKITFGQAITKLLQATKAERGASPNGGPAKPLGNSGAMEGPPSVS
jgi:hypothetical protein